MSPSIFPSYLVPSLPFRRRKSSTDSNISASSTATNDSTSSENYLDGNTSHLRCFTGRHGRAYLVSASDSWVQAASNASKKDALPNLPNTFTHKPVPRQLVTGAHTVSDVSCAQCGSVLGWKYVAAEEESQQYKVGKFILETRRTCRSSGWEGQADAVVEAGGVAAKSQSEALDDVEFDSQDEDECEDLFMGIWTPQTAARRRKKKAFSKQSS
ncbi:yippee-domain-containing protein [Aureobasidium sp. EXF-12298]|nr:yippee-domain-containing protein [Aureobasidium sp. EXF-12298]KAI4764568.1 yippee-domain-containing protein [Aureobasidium sp. EXF-12344]KAI4782221.1 yippee-domain-containing protein [Aureobasidium sp. EXF-3400]